MQKIVDYGKKRGRKQKKVEYRKKRRKRAKEYSKLYSKEEDQKNVYYITGELETLITENSNEQT